ncbi:MAG: response regulator transcription factor [Bacteroidota bacterium]|nr:response regulator transcription factor [Bacteroidota bacterium]
MRNIIIADNQDISNAGWHYLLANQADISEIHDVSEKKELLALLIEHPNSLVILDYTLFNFESVNELLILEVRFNEADWILFSDELSDEFLRTLLYNTHSFSVLMKDCTREEIGSAIREALRGYRYICNHVSNLLLDNNKNIQSLNARQILTITEQEILKEMALGKTTKEIAAHRNVSAHTIMTHRKNIFRKIEVNNVHEATKYAMRAGIVDLAEYYI